MNGHVTPLPETAFYRDGHAAYHAGKSVHICAWQYGTFQRKQWMLGYFAAERSMVDAVKANIKTGECK